MTQYCIANWKMTGSLEMIHDYVSSFTDQIQDVDPEKTQIILCPPHPYLSFTVSKCVGQPIAVGGQDCTSSDKAASTSEVSSEMLEDVGATYVIVGHSEYRQRYAPDNSELTKKLGHAIAKDLRPVFCIGESLQDYNAKKTKDILAEQLKVLKSASDVKSLLIAYEPVWAIGSGKTPTTDEINNICHWISDHISEHNGCVLPILYGGSVKPENAKAILSLDAVDGVLVGGASLDPTSFAKICKATS